MMDSQMKEKNKEKLWFSFIRDVKTTLSRRDGYNY